MRSRIRFLAALAGLLSALASERAWAWEWLPEFQSLTEEEEETYEGPARISMKYTSDMLAYLKPESWEYLWLSHRKALDLSFGSVSAQHFLMSNRLKVHEPLNDWLEFRFTWFDERNLERSDPRHTIFEFVIWPQKWVGISFYGEPDLYKRNDDTGIALLFKPNERHEIRIFNTFVDVTRLKRNDQSDTYIEPYLPYSRGIVGRWYSDPASGRDEFFEYALRHETKTRWFFPGVPSEYDYWKLLASFYWLQEITPSLKWSGRILFDRKSEMRNDPTGASLLRRDRLLSLLRAILPRFGPNQDWELTLGMSHAFRSWEADDGTAYYRDLLPHFWLRLPAFGVGPPDEQDHWMFGMDAQLHESSGPSNLLLPTEDSYVWLGRLNLAYEFQFGKKGSLKLIATADLDEIGTTKSWGGGCAQFALRF